MRRFAIALALLVGACAHHPAQPIVLAPPDVPPVAVAPAAAPEILTVTVKTPSPAAPCKVTVKEPPHPDSAAALRAAPSVEDRYQLIAAGRQVWMSWTKELEAALRKCGGQVSNQ